MRQREIKLFFNYRYNMQCRLENDVRQLQQNVRYRNIDVIDCLELSLALERLNTFHEVIKDVSLLLGLSNSDSDEVL